MSRPWDDKSGCLRQAGFELKSDESGRNEVYVQRFPDSDEKVQISTRGGDSPRWAPSGRELYFLSIDRRLVTVKVNLAKPLQVGTPTPLFDTTVDLGANRYVPTQDGKRFLLSIGTAENNREHVVVAINWAEHLATSHGSR